MPLPFSTHSQVPYALSLAVIRVKMSLRTHASPCSGQQVRRGHAAGLCPSYPILTQLWGAYLFPLLPNPPNLPCMSSTIHFHATEKLFCLYFLTKEKKGNAIVVSV